MKAPLSEEQRQAIRQSTGLPLEVSDQQTNEVFFLISAEQYERARTVFEQAEELDPSLYEFEDVKLADSP
jgi:hypothetical protein